MEKQVQKTIYRVIRIDYVQSVEIDEDDAVSAVVKGLCDAGNGIIGDDLDGDGTKIQIVTDCGESV